MGWPIGQETLEPRRTPRLRPYLVLVLLGALPVAALGIYTYHLASRSLERHILAGNQTAAQITRDLVERDFKHWVTTLKGFSRLPEVVAAVEARDEEAVRRRLQVLVAAKPRVVRAFVTDRSGLLWSDYPKAPESLGKRFDHRDWYRGVTRSWRPYVSRVYRRHAEPKALLVAVAAPVREKPGEQAEGVVVYQVRLEGLAALLQRVELGGGGFVFLVDHTGVVVAHPGLDLQQREFKEYAGTAPVQAVRQGDQRTVRYSDPFSDEPMLAAAAPCDVQGHEWVIVAQQPQSAAYRTVDMLGWQIAGAGLLLAVVVTGLCFGLARFHNRLLAVNRALEGVNQRLVEENAHRVDAERALKESHDELERRVEQRTRELQQKEEQLLHAQKLEAVGRLAGGVAHDFNNLLSLILGYGDMVLSNLPKDAPLRPEIEGMQEAGERAGVLTRQLLAFSRKQVLQPQVLDLNDVVESMDKMLRRIIGEDIDLVTNLGSDLDTVKVDPGQMEQIIANLVVNARDAMPDGGKLTVETANVTLDQEYLRRHAEARAGPHVMLAISDTGSGMDDETKARIFEPFFTTKELGQGTGLGLSTVYGIIKQTGGSIWVYSEVGHGTTFKVYLPASGKEEGAAKARRPEPSPPAEGKTLLVVEDESSVRELVVRILRSHGYGVLAAGSAVEALEVAGAYEGVIDLLVTDVILPGIDGPELAEAFKEQRPGMKVLFMSGYTDRAIVRHGVLDASTAYLEKPIRPSRLLGAVRQVLVPDQEAAG